MAGYESRILPFSNKITYTYQELINFKNNGSLIETEVEEYDRWLRGIPQYYAFDITDQNDELIECMGVFEFTTLKEMIGKMKERSEHSYDFLFDTLLKQEENYL